MLCERRRRRRVGFRLGLQRNVEGQQYALPDTTLEPARSKTLFTDTVFPHMGFIHTTLLDASPSAREGWASQWPHEQPTNTPHSPMHILTMSAPRDPPPATPLRPSPSLPVPPRLSLSLPVPPHTPPRAPPSRMLTETELERCSRRRPLHRSNATFAETRGLVRSHRSPASHLLASKALVALPQPCSSSAASRLR